MFIAIIGLFPRNPRGLRVRNRTARSCGPDGFVDATEGQRLLRRTGLQERFDKAKQQISWGKDLPDQMRYIPEVFFFVFGDSDVRRLNFSPFGISQIWTVIDGSRNWDLVLADESRWKKKTKNHKRKFFQKSH